MLEVDDKAMAYYLIEALFAGGYVNNPTYPVSYTHLGGMTSHAAVVARGMGTCCVSGCGNDNEVKIDEAVSYTHLDVYKRQRAGWCMSGA